jgi:hypothetical protein
LHPEGRRRRDRHCRRQRRKDQRSRSIENPPDGIRLARFAARAEELGNPATFAKPSGPGPGIQRLRIRAWYDRMVLPHPERPGAGR